MHNTTRSKNLIRFGAVVSLVPLFVAPIVLWSIWRLNNSPVQLDLWSQTKRAASTLDPALLGVLVIGAVLVTALLIRRGVGAIGSVAVVLATTTMGGWIASSYISGPPGFELEVPEGTTVWCNGVKLAEGRFEMTFEEFDRKVKPVSTPPDQPRVVTRDDPHFPSHKWYQAAWELIPGDPHGNNFGRFWPPFPEYAELMNVMRRERYWWRFEKNGCTVVTGSYVNFHRLGGIQHSGTVHPSYATKQLHIEALKTLLRDDGYERDAVFDEHIEKYSLERAFRSEKSRSTNNGIPRVVSGALVQLNSKIQAEQLLESVVDRVLAQQKIVSPSKETNDLLAVGQQFPDVIRERLAKAVPMQWGRLFGHNNHTTLLDAKVRAGIEGMLVGAVAVEERIVAEELFDECVLHQQWRLLPMYDRPETLPVLKTLLEQKSDSFGSSSRGVHFLQQYLRAAMQSTRPDVQKLVQEYLLRADESADQWLIYEFVDRQIELGADPIALADWVQQHPGISPDGLPNLLARIAPSDFGSRMDSMPLDSTNHSNFKAAKEPVVEWLIASYATAADDQAAWLMTALAMNIDNKQVRDFLAKRLATGALAVQRVSDGLKQGSALTEPWVAETVTALLEDEELDDDHRFTLLRLLARSETSSAEDTIAQQRARYPKVVARASFWLKQMADRGQARLEQINLAKSLLAGEIQPADLLESEPYVWGERGYEKASRD